MAMRDNLFNFFFLISLFLIHVNATVDPEWARLQNPQPYTLLPDNYLQRYNCNNRDRRGWKVNTCFVCVHDTRGVGYSCKISYLNGIAAFDVYSGTSCEDTLISTEYIQMSGPADTCNDDGVDAITTYIDNATPYVVHENEAAYSYAYYHDSCGVTSPFQYAKYELNLIPGTTDYCMNEPSDEGEIPAVSSMRITAGCTWEQGYNGANCEGELDGLAKYSKGIHNEMCFPEEVSLDFAIDEAIELMNGYRVNTTYSSIGKLFQSYGSFCSTGPSSPSKCFSNSG